MKNQIISSKLKRLDTRFYIVHVGKKKWKLIHVSQVEQNLSKFMSGFSSFGALMSR